MDQINNAISALHSHSKYGNVRGEYALSSRYVVKTTDRLVNSFAPPRADTPTKDELLDPRTLFPRLDVLKEHFREEGRLSEEHALMIVQGALKLFREDSRAQLRLPRPQQREMPITVIGSIYGQFRDLLNVFAKFGDPVQTVYVFLGDYINGGAFSVECYLYLCALKIHYPSNIIMLKGDEEYAQKARKHDDRFFKFSFETECEKKYSKALHSMCLRSFSHLPLYAVLFDKVLCVHSGVSREFATLDSFVRNERGEIDVLFGNLSTGSKRFAYSPSPCTKRYTKEFTPDMVDTFLAANKLSAMVRSHEAPLDGLDVLKTPKGNTIFTIFSAPAFGEARNNGSGMIFLPSGKIMHKSLKEVADPYVPPNHMNAFQLSLPIASTYLKDFVECFVRGLGNMSVPADYPELSPEDKQIIERHAQVVERSQLQQSVARACTMLASLNVTPAIRRQKSCTPDTFKRAEEISKRVDVGPAVSPVVNIDALFDTTAFESAFDYKEFLSSPIFKDELQVPTPHSVPISDDELDNLLSFNP